MSEPNDLGPIDRSVCISVLVLAWVAVSLRCYVRTHIIKRLGADDWFLFITLICFTAQIGINFVGVFYGIGKHLVDFPSLSRIEKAMMYWLIDAILYTITMTLLKISICLFLLRIAGARWSRLILWGTIALSVIFGTFFAFFLLFECHPIQNFWTLEQVNCIPQSIMVKVTLVHSSIMAAGDWTCAILPIFLVWNLQMNKRMKVSVAILLSIAALGGVATIVRMINVVNVSQTMDPLYVTAKVVIWSVIEPGMGIISVSLATLRPLFRILRGKTIAFSNSLGSSKPFSRSRSQSRQLKEYPDNWSPSEHKCADQIRLTHLECGSPQKEVESPSTATSREFKTTTTIKGPSPVPITVFPPWSQFNTQKLGQKDDEGPILPPVIYKRCDISTERSRRGKF